MICGMREFMLRYFRVRTGGRVLGSYVELRSTSITWKQSIAYYTDRNVSRVLPLGTNLGVPHRCGE